MSTEIVQGKENNDIISLLNRQIPAFKRVLNTEEAANRFVRIAITTLKGNNKLLACDPMSLLGAFMQCAQLGLEPNTPLQEAFLIPYGDRVNFQVGYRGLEKLVWNSGMIVNFDYDKVCENDIFEYSKGFNPMFLHIPDLKKDRGEPYAYYALADIKGGGRAAVVMSKADVLNHAKKYSKMYNKQQDNFNDRYGKQSVWDTNFDEMAIKTVIIQLCSKKLPKSTTKEMLQMITASNTDNTEIKMRPEQISQNLELGELNVISNEEEEAIGLLTPDILKDEPEQKAADFNSKLNNSMNNKKVDVKKHLESQKDWGIK